MSKTFTLYNLGTKTDEEFFADENNIIVVPEGDYELTTIQEIPQSAVFKGRVQVNAQLFGCTPTIAQS